MTLEQLDVLHIIFNYSASSEAPTKSTMVSKLIISEEFDIKEGDEVKLNGFDTLIQRVHFLEPPKEHVRIVIATAETITKEDMYNSIIEYFIENEWKCEDSMYLYPKEGS